MPKVDLYEEKRCHSIIGAFFEVYNHLGFGFLERFYASALECELSRRGHSVARETKVRLTYKGEVLGWQRLDFIVDGLIVLEIKASENLHPTKAAAQVLSYLRATNLPVGFVFHFGREPRFLRVFSYMAISRPKSR